jgi:hypothetical protein
MLNAKHVSFLLVPVLLLSADFSPTLAAEAGFSAYTLGAARSAPA